MSCQEAVAHPDQVRIQLTTPGRMSGRVKKTSVKCDSHPLKRGRQGRFYGRYKMSDEMIHHHITEETLTL